jgi:hypothetical protein
MITSGRRGPGTEANGWTADSTASTLWLDISGRRNSVGHYRVEGLGPGGMTVERDGEDPDQALVAAIEDAAELNARLGLPEKSSALRLPES